ncbi:MAG TPA: DUF2520 domain-containing protein, partial [Kofleriaceae bacterium]|nr:DUF2520 domain-containing protein [Kofleriaceae bacterium]
VLLECEVVVLAVRDAAVPDVATMLVGTGLVNKRHVLLHCAGAASAEELLGGVAGRVGGIGTLHPLSAIADARAAMRHLEGVVFGVEGDEAGRRAAEKLVAAMKGHVLPLASTQMAAYHCAAALASNYLVAALDAAAQVLAADGLPVAQSVQALLALAEGALRNVAQKGTTNGLTGPARRGDAPTIRRHLEALRAMPDVAEIYRALARRAVEIAARIDGPDAPDRTGLDAIRTLLES